MAAILQLDIAIAEEWTADLIGALSEYDTAVAGTQSGNDCDKFNRYSVRVQLMTQAELDPMQPSHPAQQAVLRRLSSHKDVHDQFEYRILWLDFRLAVLRFALGIPAVDDQFYAQPQQMLITPKPCDRFDQQRRFHRVLASCQQAEQYGRKLDQLLQTIYRQDLIAKRRVRIQAIQAWVAEQAH